jgi:hypothetical protein
LSESEAEAINRNYEELVEEAQTLRRQAEHGHCLWRRHPACAGGRGASAEEQRALDWTVSAAALEGAAELEQLSLLYSDEDEGFDGESFIFPGGYD